MTALAPPSLRNIKQPSSTFVEEFRMKEALMEIDSSIATTIVHLRDAKDSCSPETALSKLKAALTNIPPLLQYMDIIISRFDQTEKTLSQGKHLLFSKDDAPSRQGTINRLKEFLRIWMESKNVALFLQSQLVLVEMILLQQEGEVSSNDAALNKLVGAIKHANNVLGNLWMEIVDFPQSTKVIEGNEHIRG